MYKSQVITIDATSDRNFGHATRHELVCAINVVMFQQLFGKLLRLGFIVVHGHATFALYD
jgi:hypothetical protein